MNLDNYEKADIEIKEPADIYRAMLDGCVAQFESQVVKGLHYFDGNEFKSLNYVGSMVIFQNGIDAGYWTLWRKKPKKEWWELASPEKPYLCKCFDCGSDFFIDAITSFNDKKQDFRYTGASCSWRYADPLTDAEIDQLKRGYEAR